MYIVCAHISNMSVHYIVYYSSPMTFAIVAMGGRAVYESLAEIDNTFAFCKFLLISGECINKHTTNVHPGRRRATQQGNRLLCEYQ